MKKHYLNVLLISCFLLGILFAREEATVLGTVSDRESGVPLIAVNIYLKNTVNGTITNEEGCFILPGIPPGDYELIAGMIGYEHFSRKIRLSPGERLQMDIVLRQTVLDYGKNVMVTASRTQKYIEEIPGSVDLITEEALLIGNPQDLGEALRDIKGVMIKSYGGLGSSQMISLRGSSSEQVLVLIDGQRVNNAQNGSVDLSNIPSHDIRQIEVVKGANSALYGSDAVGGVINIITKDSAEKNNLRISFKGMLGSFRSGALESSLRYREKGFSFSTAYKYLNSLGNFPYTDNYGSRQIRVNSDILSHSITSRVGYVFGASDKKPEIDLKYTHFQSERGAPGTIEPYYYEARMWDRSNNITLNVSSKIIDQFNDMRFSASWQNTYNRYLNNEMLVHTDNDFSTQSLNTELQGHSVLKDYLMLTYGVGQHNNQMVNYQQDTTYHRQTWYAFILNESDINFRNSFLRSLIITPSLRYDSHSDFNNVVSPKIGFVLNIGEKWKTGIKSNFGLSYRAPTFNDLYWPEDAYTVGNPDLKPESGMDWDFGARMQYPVLDGLYLESVFFHNYMTNLIIWESSGEKWRPDNVDEARIYGLENGLKLDIINGYLSTDINYTYLRAINLSQNITEYGKQLIYRPRHSFNASLTGTYKILTCQYTLSITGKRYTDRSNVELNALPAYSISDLAFIVRPQLRDTQLILNFQIKNLFNANYRVMKNLPMPGREFRLSVEVEFNKKTNKRSVS